MDRLSIQLILMTGAVLTGCLVIVAFTPDRYSWPAIAVSSERRVTASRAPAWASASALRAAAARRPISSRARSVMPTVRA